MADLELVEGDTSVEQQFVLTAEGNPVDLSGAFSVDWFTFRRPDDNGPTASDSATILSPLDGLCSVTLGSDHMDSVGMRRVRMRVNWAEFDQDHWFPSDRSLELSILPHTRART